MLLTKINRAGWVTILALVGLTTHLLLRWLGPHQAELWPLWVALAVGGGALLIELVSNLIRGEMHADFLAGISIVTAVVLEEFLAGTLVVLMLSGGKTLESFAVAQASSALAALAKRMPTIAHRRQDGILEDVPLENVAIGDRLIILPHESCPVDGVVIEGHGTMDESYLTGEPYHVSKTPGAQVLSGAINGDSALTIRAVRPARDSRYAKIMEVMRESERRRPRIRRLGDQLGSFYTPFSVAVGLSAYFLSGDITRFLAVLVVATPCPLLIAIPVALIGSISSAARRGIIIRDPVVLEQLDRCRTAIFDKTGTLTYGRPDLTEILAAPGFDELTVLKYVACLERYSKHPLASAVLAAADRRRIVPLEASHASEEPGRGLMGTVAGHRVRISSRKQWAAEHSQASDELPPVAAGMECVVTIDDAFAAVLRFRDQPRDESRPFIAHLGPQHRMERVLLVSGDREAEVEHLAEVVGISEIYFGQLPEQKLKLVQQATSTKPTFFVGDGINDAPALRAATVGIAIGVNSEVTTDAAGAVVLENSILKVDELLHISSRFRTVALQSALGGMVLSLIGMVVAAFGYLPPVMGALLQELIDVIALANALRTSTFSITKPVTSDVSV